MRLLRQIGACWIELPRMGPLVLAGVGRTGIGDPRAGMVFSLPSEI